MRIVILGTAAEHRAAQQARRERDMMKSLANTDSLTTLKNRRGLNEARVGGDEFVIVATEVKTETQAADLGAKLLAVFKAPFNHGGEDCHVGVTIGYVLVPNDCTQVADLLKAADAAMYAGKQQGKGLVVRGVA